MTPSTIFFHGFFYDSGKPLQFVHSSIFLRGYTRAAAHLSEVDGRAAKLTNRSGDSIRIVGIGYQTAAGFAHNSGDVAPRGRDCQDGTARSENRIEFAGNDNSFQAAPHCHDVNVARGHYLRNLAGRPKRKKANIR
jgi:hypothetical protein